MSTNRFNRIVNLRYVCEGLHFDAAIDCDLDMHIYGKLGANVVPIELYCADHKDWDVRVVFYEELNMKQLTEFPRGMQLHTAVDMDFIISETKTWIREMQDCNDTDCMLAKFRKYVMRSANDGDKRALLMATNMICGAIIEGYEDFLKGLKLDILSNRDDWHYVEELSKQISNIITED